MTILQEILDMDPESLDMRESEYLDYMQQHWELFTRSIKGGNSSEADPNYHHAYRNFFCHAVDCRELITPDRGDHFIVPDSLENSCYGKRLKSRTESKIIDVTTNAIYSVILKFDHPNRFLFLFFLCNFPYLRFSLNMLT